MVKLKIGLDIGGTKIDGIVWDGKKIVKQLTILTPKTLFEFGHNIGKLIMFLRGKDKITTLGVSMAGYADKNKKVLVSSPNIRYVKNFSFEKFGKSLGFKKIALDNDASCFLSTEMIMGQARGNKNVVGIILGTGLGGALYLNGKMYRGMENFGGEIGQMSFGLGVTWEQEYQKYRNKKDFKNLCKCLVRGFYVLIKIFNPESFVLGGGVAEDKLSTYITSIKKDLTRSLDGKQKTPDIHITKIKHSGAIGAVMTLK